jgi:lipoprotein-releasing system ATP-binding protein
LLRATNIHKSYGKVEVLRGLDLHVKSGEVVAIVGASGAGKSTLLHILGTLDDADRGAVLIEETDVTKLSGTRLARFRNRNIGFVFQFHHLLPEFSALENVCLPGFIAKRSKGEVQKAADELLSNLGLKPRLSHRPAQLSGGEQQRVAVARALINKPKVVLADEPSGNLDSANSEALHKLFFELRDKMGQTFIIATHNEQLAGMSDRTLRIKDGVIE